MTHIYQNADTKKETSKWGKLGGVCARFVIRTLIFVATLYFTLWILNDRMPSAIVWFMAGAIFNDFWDSSKE